MLNNTEQKIHVSDLHEINESQVVTAQLVTEQSAANAAQFGQGSSSERSIRRDRRNSRNTSSAANRWRVSLW